MAHNFYTNDGVMHRNVKTVNLPANAAGTEKVGFVADNEAVLADKIQEQKSVTMSASGAVVPDAGYVAIKKLNITVPDIPPSGNVSIYAICTADTIGEGSNLDVVKPFIEAYLLMPDFETEVRLAQSDFTIDMDTVEKKITIGSNIIKVNCGGLITTVTVTGASSSTNYLYDFIPETSIVNYTGGGGVTSFPFVAGQASNPQWYPVNNDGNVAGGFDPVYVRLFVESVNSGTSVSEIVMKKEDGAWNCVTYNRNGTPKTIVNAPVVEFKTEGGKMYMRFTSLGKFSSSPDDIEATIDYNKIGQYSIRVANYILG